MENRSQRIKRIREFHATAKEGGSAGTHKADISAYMDDEPIVKTNIRIPTINRRALQEINESGRR